MEMPMQAVFANPAVRQLEGRVAIQRGPIVYCLEGVDHGDIILDRISVDPADIALASRSNTGRTCWAAWLSSTAQGKVIDADGWDERAVPQPAPAGKQISPSPPFPTASGITASRAKCASGCGQNNCSLTSMH